MQSQYNQSTQDAPSFDIFGFAAMNGVVMLIKVIFAYNSKPFTQYFGMVVHFIALFPRIVVFIFRMSRTEKTEKRGVVLQFWATEKL